VRVVVAAEVVHGVEEAGLVVVVVVVAVGDG